jgi:hypothetical protein
MRWDLDSRKEVYEDSDKWLKEGKTRYEQEMMLLKSMLSEDNQNAYRKKVIKIQYAVGITIILMVTSILFVLLSM